MTEIKVTVHIKTGLYSGTLGELPRP